MNTQEVTLDVTKRPQISPVLYLGQGDRNGTTLRASMYDDGAQLSLSGKSVRFAMRSPNGQAYYEVNGTVSGNVATFAIDETYAAAISGVTDVAYVEVLEGSTVICSTNRFRVVILESAQEGADPAHAYESGIIEATERANEAAEAAEGVVLQAVPTMSANIKGGAKLGSGLAVSDQTLSVDASDITNGTLHVANGGTGASTAAAARANLDAAQSEGAAGSLYDAEQAIADNAAAIAQLRESVSPSDLQFDVDYYHNRKDLLGTIKEIFATMGTNGANRAFRVGQMEATANGHLGYVAYRYPGQEYGAVLIFRYDGMCRLFYNNNGSWAYKEL